MTKNDGVRGKIAAAAAIAFVLFYMMRPRVSAGIGSGKGAGTDADSEGVARATWTISVDVDRTSIVDVEKNGVRNVVNQILIDDVGDNLFGVWGEPRLAIIRKWMTSITAPGTSFVILASENTPSGAVDAVVSVVDEFGFPREIRRDAQD